MLYLFQIWNFRSFVFGSVKREFQAKYRNSVLGATWVILPSLAQIVIYTLIFSKLIGARLPGVQDTMGYSIYLCAGIIAWSLHAEIITRNTSVFLDNSNLIKKLVFPRICLPVIVVASSLVNFVVILSLFFCFLLLTGRSPGVVIVELIPLAVLHVMLATGVGMAVGVLNVFFRDVGQFMQIFLQFWFWLTPIVYPISILPDSIARFVALNPMTSIVSGYQNIFLHGRGPDWSDLVIALVFALTMVIVSLMAYRRNVSDIVDEL